MAVVTSAVVATARGAVGVAVAVASAVVGVVRRRQRRRRRRRRDQRRRRRRRTWLSLLVVWSCTCTGHASRGNVPKLHTAVTKVSSICHDEDLSHPSQDS